jgi:hypothetical protein
VKKSFSIQELLPNGMEPKPMHPFLSRAFQRLHEHDLKHPDSVDLITTKQNKTNYLPSQIDLWTCKIKSLENEC